MLSTLQQLQHSDPAQYGAVTKKISENLQTAAQTATSQGNTAAATQLTQLAKDFSTASTGGRLPNIQDLANILSGGAHHHHHHHGGSGGVAGSDSRTNSGGASSTGTSGSTGTTLNQLEQLFGSAPPINPQSHSLNPFSIILNTLSTAGIKAAND